jgi:ribose transport system substrate-binding protein
LPFVVNVGKSMGAISKKLGITFVDYPNQGQPSQWVTGIDQAITRKADLIVLNTGADPRLLGPQIKAARAAGIAVLVVHQYADTDTVAPNLSASVPAPFLKVGRLLADGAIAATNGQTHALLIADNEYTSSQDIVRVARDEFRRRCPKCSLTVISVPVAQWATKIQSEVQTGLLRDKRINFVIPMFDAMQQWAVPGIVAAGAGSRVQTGSYNGDPAVLKRIGNVVNFTIGESADQLGYAYMDEALRILTGKKAVAHLQTPIRFFDKTNVAATGSPPRWSTGYGTDYVRGYLKLWGVTK